MGREKKPVKANKPPVAVDDTASVTAGQSVTIPVLANDTDPEGGALTLVSATASTGTVTVEGAALVYAAPASFAGTATLTYTVRDPAGATAQGRVTVTVAAANKPPVAVDDVASVTAGQSVTIPVLANDTDPEGGALTLVSATASTGTVTVAGTALVYAAPASFAGTATLTYTVRDPAGATAQGRVTVTVAAANKPPVAVDDVASVTAGQSVTIPVLANDTDPEGGALTLVSATASTGTVTVEGAALVYAAPASFAGTATLTYTVRDPAGATAQGRVTVTVAAANKPPVAVDDVASVTAGQSVTIPVLANDTDPEGGALTLVSATASTGTVTVAGTALVYAAPASFAGTATLTYTVRDPAGATAQGRVTVTVAAANKPPVAVDDVASVTAGQSVTIPVLANDTDPEGGALTLVSATASTGTVTVAGTALVYAAPASFAGTATLTYTVRDPAGATAQGRVTVTVAAANKPPVAVDDVASVTAGQSVTIPVLANDTDPEGGALTLVSATASTGTVTVAGTALVYAAPASFAGTATLTYTVRDPAGATAQGRVTVTVAAANKPPVAVDDVASVTAGQSVTIPVLANDTDPEGGALTLVSATASTGTVTVEGAALVYAAPASFAGTATLTYTVRDPAGATAQGRVTVTVAAEISISAGPDGTFTVETADDNFVLTVIEPADHAGDYAIQVADLAGGPVNVVAPRVSGEIAVGATLTAATGLWACDESHRPLAISRQWYRGTVPIEGATGETYVVAEGDALEGIRHVTTATDAAGTRSVEVEAVAKIAVSEPPPPATAAPPPSAPVVLAPSIRFDGSVRMKRSTGFLALADTSAIFGFIDFVPAETINQGILRQQSAREGLEVWDGRVQFAFHHPVNRQLTVSSRLLAIGQRARVIGMSRFDGTSTRTAIYSRLGDETGWTLDQEAFVAGELLADLTRNGFTVAGRHNAAGTDQNLRAEVFRIALWAGSIPDVAAPGTFEALVRADGTLEDPGISRARFGVPCVDLYGARADYAAGLNHGTAGNFDVVEGSFPDA